MVSEIQEVLSSFWFEQDRLVSIFPSIPCEKKPPHPSTHDGATTMPYSGVYVFIDPTVFYIMNNKNF